MAKKERTLSAIEAIIKTQKMNARSFENPTQSAIDKILAPQRAIYDAVSGPAKAIQKQLTVMDVMSGMAKKFAHDSIVYNKGIHKQLNGISALTELARSSERNRNFYNSFLEASRMTSQMQNQLKWAESSISALSVLSATRHSTFANTPKLTVFDLITAGAFKKVQDLRAESGLEDYETIIKEISSDEELRKDVESYIQTNKRDSGSDTESSSSELVDLTIWLATKIGKRFGYDDIQRIVFFLEILRIVILDVGPNIYSLLQSDNQVQIIEKATSVENHYHIINQFRSIEVAQTDVHLRNRADKRSKSIGVVLTGQKVEVLEQGRKWMRVAYVDNETGEPKSGWVYMVYFDMVNLSLESSFDN